MNLAIGDIHGRNCWEHIDLNQYDNVYFLGDYFDTHDKIVTSNLQIENFKNIVREARNNSNIHLCIGNHDFQYLSGVSEWERYSGFQSSFYHVINEALEQNIDLLRFVYIYKDFIISHAGISNMWYISNGFKNIEDINKCIEQKNYQPFYFNGIDPYGNDKIQSCIWIRPESLLKSKFEGYKQIVGHTPVSKIATIAGVTLCDCLGTIVQFYEFE